VAVGSSIFSFLARPLNLIFLYLFVSHSNYNKVREIVEKEDPDFVQRIDKEGHTFLHWAALAGNNDLIEYLLDKGVPLNEHSHNDYGPRPIHWACVHGNVKTIDLFLEKGVAIDTTDLNGCTPLIVSAQYGQSLSISYLLQKGANKFHVDINGDTALHWAAFKGSH
jgi:ankyrin repeat protein